MDEPTAFEKLKKAFQNILRLRLEDELSWNFWIKVTEYFYFGWNILNLVFSYVYYGFWESEKVERNSEKNKEKTKKYSENDKCWIVFEKRINFTKYPWFMALVIL